MKAEPDSDNAYILRGNEIYHRGSNSVIMRPAFTYDAPFEGLDGYVLLKIGNFEDCEAYRNLMVNSNPDVFGTVGVFEFDNTLSKTKVCELMNTALNCTGYIENIIKGKI